MFTVPVWENVLPTIYQRPKTYVTVATLNLNVYIMCTWLDERFKVLESSCLLGHDDTSRMCVRVCICKIMHLSKSECLFRPSLRKNGSWVLQIHQTNFENYRTNNE